jgi:hypothetical protein
MQEDDVINVLKAMPVNTIGVVETPVRLGWEIIAIDMLQTIPTGTSATNFTMYNVDESGTAKIIGFFLNGHPVVQPTPLRFRAGTILRATVGLNASVASTLTWCITWRRIA